MSNLDLTIAEIMHGDTQVLKIMKGDEQKWPQAFFILGDLTHVASSVQLPAIVSKGEQFTTTLIADTSYYLNDSSVVVTMGEVDITSTSYDSTTNTINIASVTGNVEILAEAEIVWEQLELTQRYLYRGTAVGGTAPGESNSYYESIKSACVAGDKYKVTGTVTGGSIRLWMWLDSEEKIISISATRITLTNYEMTAPTGAAWFILNCNNGNPRSCYKLKTE